MIHTTKLIFKLIAVLSVFSAFIVSCQGDDDVYIYINEDSGPDTDSDSDSDSDSDGDTDTDSDSDTDADSDSDTDTDTECQDQSIPVNRSPVRYVWLLDVSISMGGYVDIAETAINNILSNWSGGQIQFGFDYYPSTSSGVNTTIPVAPASGSETAISSLLSVLSTYGGGTPTYQALQNYAIPGYAGGFPEAGVDCYLVIITDGAPNSGTAAEFTTLVTSLLSNGIKTTAIGYNYSGSVLSTIASAGGMPSPMNSPILVSDGVALESAFNDIAAESENCAFTIDSAAASADSDNVNFYFDGVVVPMNAGCTGSGLGWDWLDSTHTQIEFCQTSCSDIFDVTPVVVTSSWGCPTVVS